MIQIKKLHLHWYKTETFTEGKFAHFYFKSNQSINQMFKSLVFAEKGELVLWMDSFIFGHMGAEQKNAMAKLT